MTTPIRLFSLALLLILGAGQQQSHATVISVNIVAGGGAAVGSNTAGVVPVNNWNDVSYSGAAVGPQTLNTDSGTFSGLSASIPGGYLVYTATPSPNFGPPNPAGDNALMSGHIYLPSAGKVDINFSGTLPFSAYDLYVYYNSGSVANSQTFTVLNGLTPVASAIGSEVQGSDTAFVFSTGLNNANYVIIPGLTLANFTLEAQGFASTTGGGPYSYINGVQLVGVAAPEPSSWCLLAIGAVAFGTIARRRRSPA